MINYFRLVRYKNLLFLALALWCMHRCVAIPILASYGFSAESVPLSTWHFALLVIAVLCIAAAGYAINDYFDVKIDAINHPVNRLVGVSIDRQTAARIHQVLSVIGIICGLTVSADLRSMMLAVIIILVPGMLWFYSASYKRQFLIGNIIIALATSLAILLMAIAHIAALKHQYGNEILMQTPIVPALYTYIGCFALFAFLITLIREIIKDMEDQAGDREMECRTVPIVLGDTKTKIVVISLILITIAILCLIISKQANNATTWRYMAIGIMLPMIILAIITAMAKNTTEYHNAQQLTKYIMAIGTLYSILFYYSLAIAKHIPFFGLTAA
ncbi:MAG TPA: hypothetical protein DEO38_02755 [Bacteroidales bacterium]|nr:hypothetical protein [Bacteroidales bacterium]